MSEKVPHHSQFFGTISGAKVIRSSNVSEYAKREMRRFLEGEPFCDAFQSRILDEFGRPYKKSGDVMRWKIE